MQRFQCVRTFSRDNECLSQGKIFKNETTTSGKETSDGAEDGFSDLEHAPGITCGRKEATRRKFLISKPSKVWRVTVTAASRAAYGSIPVVFRLGTNPTGIRATSFKALISTTETSFVTALATYAVLPSGVSVNHAAPFPPRKTVPVTFK